MTSWTTVFLAVLVSPFAVAQDGNLFDARRGFETTILGEPRQQRAMPEPPEDLFSVVYYEAPLGENSAYLSHPPDEESLHPAIVWITGGFPTARGGSVVWTPGPPENDQSASAYRDAGIIMMFPTVRGTCENPGLQEQFYGEVDYVIAAGRYLQELECVDPENVYLGGHSTGGTLVLLVAEATDLFRAVFSFGPVARAESYGEDATFDHTVEGEFRLRSPVHFLNAITSPTYIIEGEHGRLASLLEMQRASSNPRVHCVPITHSDHFAPLAPINRRIAHRIANLNGRPFRWTTAETRSAFETARTSAW